VFKFAPVLGPLLLDTVLSGAVAPELSPPAEATRAEA
jgi:hypothetical protein